MRTSRGAAKNAALSPASGGHIEIDPGRNQDEWRSYAVAMRLSAVQLAQATQDNDRLAMFAAAHRLDASCRKCHDVFR